MTDESLIRPVPRLDRIAVFTALALFVLVQVIAAQRIGFAFEYPLDDVYIHLAMASEIARGGYGVNDGEIASAASSALYPVLLTPFPDTVFQRFLPLIWNILGLALTAYLWGRLLLWAGISAGAGLILAVIGPLFIGAVSTAYIGMEHTLHAAASLAIVYGLARSVFDGRLHWALFAGLMFAPLLRFEGLALCTLAVLVLGMRGRPLAAILGAILTFVPIGAFVWYLTSLGLDPLPNSVQAKLSGTDAPAFGFLTRIADTLQFNMLRYGGLAISGLAAAVLGAASIGHTNRSVALPIFSGALVAVAIAGLAYFSTDLETYERLVGPSIAGLMIGLFILGTNLLRALGDDDTDNGPVWFALALAAAGMGHVLLAQTGWMERYEHYAIAALAGGLVVLAGRAVRATPTLTAICVIVIGLGGVNYGWKTASQYHWGSRAIHLQQSQLATYAKDFLGRNVAVNDLGWVAWNNPNYVLDLYGLANHEARALRLSDAPQGWGGPLVKAHDVSVIMIYRNFVGAAIADEWVPLGMLVMNEARGYLGDDRVHFYAADFTQVPHAEATLREWNKTLLPGTCFVREGDENCWR